MDYAWTNDTLQLGLNEKAVVHQFVDRRTGVNYARRDSAPLGLVRIGTNLHPATALDVEGDRLRLEFGSVGATAELHLRVEPHHMALEVLNLTGGDIDALVFLDVMLTLTGAPGEPFAACALALNLQTNVEDLPRPTGRLRAECFRRFGFAGAQTAIVACPAGELRTILQEVVSATPTVPHSPIGGPWALDAPINRESYLFNWGDVTEKTVDDWIAAMRKVGITQLDFHGGESFRFGDLVPNPVMYPNGLTSLKAVIDRLHEAGIAAGLHTYSYFLSKSCPWVTPVPDPRLAKDATFTLAGDLSAGATAVPVMESTAAMSTITAFEVRNSVTLQIDNELITYSGIDKAPPYAFTGCERGACGTHVAPHAAGAPVHHLKQLWGLFAPEGDSTLFTEIAARTAEVFNSCGFDMIYLDALDGEDIFAGREFGWHYGAKFVFAIWEKLERPALQEMSTFHHHLWYVRSRMGAWDLPTRGHKRFIDMHVASNKERGAMLPAHLGWWGFLSKSTLQNRPTFADDIEYLCTKALGTDTGLSLQGWEPGAPQKNAMKVCLAAIVRRWETLRHAGTVSESVKALLREPGAEFTLEGEPPAAYTLRPSRAMPHTVTALGGADSRWTVANPYGAQPIRLRIEGLCAAAPYDSPKGVVLANFADGQEFPEHEATPDITTTLRPSANLTTGGTAQSGELSAMAKEKGGWARWGMPFSPPMDFSAHPALGLWVHGDGRGEVLNFVLKSLPHLRCLADHYLVVDFTGWRYVTLIESEDTRLGQYRWPYVQDEPNIRLHRNAVDYRQIAGFDIYVGQLPPGVPVTCHLSPIRALPLADTVLKNPSLTLDGHTVTFPTTIPPGCFLEFLSMDNCRLYGKEGELLELVTPQGALPCLSAGANDVRLTCDETTDPSARAKVTLFSQGNAL